MSQIFMGQYPYDGYKVYVEYHSKRKQKIRNSKSN